MYSALTQLIEYLDSDALDPAVIKWASPVPYFGSIGDSVVATVGINPSNREFADLTGNELKDHGRRLPTLLSLGADTWSDVTGADIVRIARACDTYFETNPYRQWFDVLERLLSAGGASMYARADTWRACHLDLVAFATSTKWGALPPQTREVLVDRGRQAMATVIRDSGIRLLVLNGRSVVREFEAFAQAQLSVEPVADWSLPRVSGGNVPGLLFTGSVSEIDGVVLDREIQVLGYNHNLQSSFGVTGAVSRSIGERVGAAIVAATDS